MKTELCNYLSAWKPGDDICVIFSPALPQDNEPATPPTSEDINLFFAKLKAIAKEHKFDLATWGLRAAFESSISKKYVRAKIAETVIARDLQLKQLHPEIANINTTLIPIPEVNH